MYMHVTEEPIGRFLRRSSVGLAVKDLWRRHTVSELSHQGKTRDRGSFRAVLLCSIESWTVK